MSGDLKWTIGMAVLCIAFFGILTDDFFPYVMKLMKVTFFVCGCLCGLGFFGCLSQIFNKNKSVKK